MTPFQWAQEHSQLWHVTAADAVDAVLVHGLSSTAEFLDGCDLSPDEKERLLTRRRPLPVLLRHRLYGPIVINDNAPLDESKLAAVLDDGLSPSDWLRMLNARVFFFTSLEPLKRLMDAPLNVKRPKRVLMVKTRPLAEAYREAMEIVPINSGNTNYDPARRGRSTFAPLLPTDYARWQRQRGNKRPDTIKEVAIRGSVPDIARYVDRIHDGAEL